MSFIINPYSFAAIGGGFSPSDIAGLQVWLKADAITGLSDNDPVTTWEDSSSANHDATQATGGNKPTYQTNELNSLPVVRFDGTDDYLRTGSFTLALPTTVFVVSKVIAETSIATQFDGLSNQDTMEMRSKSSPDGTYEIYANGFLSTNVPGNVGTYKIYSIRFNGASSAVYVNASLHATGTVGASSPNGITLGCYGNASPDRFSQMDMAEFIVYDSALADADRQDVESYLNAKYAVF